MIEARFQGNSSAMRAISASVLSSLTSTSN